MVVSVLLVTYPQPSNRSQVSLGHGAKTIILITTEQASTGQKALQRSNVGVFVCMFTLTLSLSLFHSLEIFLYFSLTDNISLVTLSGSDPSGYRVVNSKCLILPATMSCGFCLFEGVYVLLCSFDMALNNQTHNATVSYINFRGRQSYVNHHKLNTKAKHPVSWLSPPTAQLVYRSMSGPA